MTYELRRLGVEDLPAAWEMSRLAFGGENQPPAAWLTDRPGRQTWGAFDGAGRLVAKATDREQGHWFGGRLVPASGIAGVAVVPELRGAGLARQVLTRLLHSARERGAAISTLFRTTPVPYRRLGWEQVGSLSWTALPAASLAALRKPEQMTLRPARAADVPAVLEVYRSLARSGNGLMERSAPLFDTSAEAVIAGHDGFTLAVGPEGHVDGYASWDRGPGYDSSGRLSVPDLIGLTAPATTALLAMLASWASVTPTLHLRLPEADPVRLQAAMTGARIESDNPWMIRLLDAPAAVAARGWPSHLDGSVDIVVLDDECPWNAGPHRLTVSCGSGRLEPGGRGNVRFTSRGIAAWYSGAGGSAVLRRAGLLDGDDSRDGFLESLTGGPAPALLDYF